MPDRRVVCHPRPERRHPPPSQTESPPHGSQDQRQAAAPPADEEAELMAAVAPRIVSGEPMAERKSTFQAHVCRVADAREVAAVIAVLLQNNK